MMSKDRSLLAATTLAALAVAPVQIVVAADYLSVEAAQKSLFPQGDHFDEIVLALSLTQKQKVAALAGAQPPQPPQSEPS